MAELQRLQLFVYRKLCSVLLVQLYLIRNKLELELDQKGCVGRLSLNVCPEHPLLFEQLCWFR